MQLQITLNYSDRLLVDTSRVKNDIQEKIIILIEKGVEIHTP